jgi:starch synthase
MPKDKIKVLLVASEAVPFAKVGGLADVVGAQGKNLAEAGLDLRVAIPKFSMVYDNIVRFGAKIKRSEDITISMEGGEETGTIQEVEHLGVRYFFVDHPGFFKRNGIYLDEHTKQDFSDNLKRFVFFSKAVLEGAKIFDFQPDIIHSHDWQTGLLPVYLKTIYKLDSFYRLAQSVFTIHNLAYQGIFPVEQFTITGLNWKYFTINGLEYYGHLNLMKGGIVFSDVTTTVSETYAKEIQTPEYGNGLEGVMRTKDMYGNLHGIVNGVDYSEWNPGIDTYLNDKYKLNYDFDNLENKKKIKEMFLKENGIKKPDVSRPLLGVISRLVDQKGWDILLEIFDKLIKEDVYITVLGTGKYEYESRLREFGEKYADKAVISIGFDIPRSHYIEAASDIFLMPSRFEPCGLNQLYSLRYGTIPVVRETGGLADTVKDGKTGFAFKNYNPDELFNTIKKALDLFKKNPDKWRKMMESGMKEDWSWAKAAKKYVELYKKAVAKKKD